MSNLTNFLKTSDIKKLIPDLNLNILDEKFDKFFHEFFGYKYILTFFNFDPENGFSFNRDLEEVGYRYAPLYGTKNSAHIFDETPDELGAIKFKNDIIYRFKQNTYFLPILIQTLLECGIKRNAGLTLIYPGKVSYDMFPNADSDNEVITGLYGLIVENEGNQEAYVYTSKTEKMSLFQSKIVLFRKNTPFVIENNLSKPIYLLTLELEIPKDQINS